MRHQTTWSKTCFLQYLTKPKLSTKNTYPIASTNQVTIGELIRACENTFKLNDSYEKVSTAHAHPNAYKVISTGKNIQASFTTAQS